MQSVTFSGYGRTEIIETPRPSLRHPGDAIVLVTTAAIGPWDIERFLSVGSDQTIPGGEFAGLVVETGEDVETIALDDLVCNTVRHVNSSGQGTVFGSTALPGGHAEYVRVPDADRTLTKIAESGEERAVFAGGTTGLGVNAAAAVLAESNLSQVAVVGCDPIGMTALIALKNAGVADQILVVEDHLARRTLASGFADRAFESSSTELPEREIDVVIVGSITESAGLDTISQIVKPGGSVVFSEPYGPSRVAESGHAFPEGVTIASASWPTVQDASKIITAMQIRRLDLTPLVSHVIPLEEVQDAYEAAADRSAGVQKVILKM